MDELGRPRRGGGAGLRGDNTGASLVEMAMALVLLVMSLGATASSRLQRPVVRSRARESHGAALVELAFALPLLIILIVGMVSAGTAYNHQLALTHAAREGGRYGATLPVNPGSMDTWLETVINQTVADATGTLDPGVPGRYICVAYVHPNGTASGDSTTRRILNTSGLQPSESDECFTSGDGRPNDERRVQVVVGRDTDFTVVFFSSVLNLDAEAVNRFEAALGA
jgi:hypothetical protein